MFTAADCYKLVSVESSIIWSFGVTRAFNCQFIAGWLNYNRVRFYHIFTYLHLQWTLWYQSAINIYTIAFQCSQRYNKYFRWDMNTLLLSIFSTENPGFVMKTCQHTKRLNCSVFWGIERCYSHVVHILLLVKMKNSVINHN